MRRGAGYLGLWLGVMTIALPAATAAAPAGAKPNAAQPKTATITTIAKPAGVPLEVQISEVSPHTTVVVHFRGAKAAGWVKAQPGSEAAIAGVRFVGSALSFTPPAVPGVAKPATVAFSTGIVISGPLSGQAVVGGTGAVALKTPFGSTTTQGGPFSIPTPRLPPTCTLGPCSSLKPGDRCSDQPGSRCYLYDEQFLCCTVCPTGC
jgi:hypothetical protein